MKATKQIETIYPLSPMQQGMLFHSLNAPDSGLYFQQLVIEIQGEFDVPSFQRAWQRVSARHVMLRTAFSWKQEKQLQVVFPRASTRIIEHDWRGMAADEQRTRLAHFLEQDRQRGFNLSEAPLLRLALIRTRDREYWFVYSHHHILLDGWSNALLLKEVMAYYQAFTRGHDLNLPQPRPYQDYIAWLQQQDFLRAEPFWREAMADFSEPTPLPLEMDPADGLPGQEARAISFPATFTTELQQYLAHHRLTLSTFVQGVWGMLLGHYAGRLDVVFGTTASGRPPEMMGVESMVGLFINTLPVRLRIRTDIRLRDWLHAFQIDQADARQYELTPLVQVQGWSEVARGVPLFESLLVVENYALDAFESNYEDALTTQFVSQKSNGLQTRILTSAYKTNYPLLLTVRPEEELMLRITWDRERLSNGTVERLLGSLDAMVRSAVADPDQLVGDLPVLSSEERRRLLVLGNAIAEPRPEHGVLHRKFEEQALANPDRIAVVHEGEQVSYATLNRRSNQLAHYLRNLGVGPDVRVAIVMGRGVNMIVALLGILKAGGAYVPIDPDYPTERIGYLIDDAQAPVVITEAHLLDSLPASWAQVTIIDNAWESLEAESELNLQDEVNSANLAYVIYTSGSSGQPKGVGVEHRQILHYLAGIAERLDLSSQSYALVSTFAADLGNTVLFPALCLGRTLHVISADRARDGARLAEYFAAHGVDCLKITPTHLTGLLQASEDAGLVPLRQLILGGESSSADLIKLIRRLRPACRIWNHYGPTETTVGVLTGSIPEGPLDAAVPLGRPLSNVRVYVLDEAQRLLPPGVPGELFIGGLGVSRGYLQQPSLTAERFIPDPFTVESGARLYRTGDKVRWRVDGHLEFLGRFDFQVKLRGFRIELGEIEAVLRERPDVGQAVAMIREDLPGEQRLVAYIVSANPEAAPATRDLQTALESKVPGYMVPSAFVFLDQLPLTPNGKIDRKALAYLDGPEEEIKSDGPRTPIEEILAGIWAHVLHLDNVGREDNFFALGGHSLLATQVISRIRDILQVELPLKVLFESPTISAVGREIEQWREETKTVEPQLALVSRDQALPLSFAQQRLWFLDQLEPQSATYNIPRALRLRGKLDRPALQRSLSEIVRRHEVLRTSYPSRNGRPVQAIAGPQSIKMPVIDLVSVNRDAREDLALELARREAMRSFDLARGPVLRASLLYLGDTDHVLLFNVHHIASDGWSTGVLIHELAALYNAYSMGLESPLPELTIQYADFSVWQRQWLDGKILEDQLNYWQKQLSGTLPLELPADRPRPAVPSRRGANLPFSLTSGLTTRLKQLGQREGMTLYMIVLAGLQSLLARYSGQEEIIIGSPIANRNRLETEGLVGFFVNTLVIRNQVNRALTFSELLRRVRKTVLDAYSHQDVPFERIVEELEPAQQRGDTPLFRIALVWQNAPSPDLALSDLAVEDFGEVYQSAKIDLTLFAWENAGGVEILAEYATELFDRRRIELLLEHLELLLESVASKPSLRLGELDLLTPLERRMLLSEWNPRPTPASDLRNIIGLFEEQAARFPETIAIKYEGQQLRYRELNARANQLACYLRKLGVGPDHLVALCLERSLELIVGILGILKAGGAYIPIDPDYPAERLAYMFGDAGTRIVLTQRDLVQSLPLQEATVLCLDSDWDLIAQQPSDNLNIPIGPENIAYVIYTSGSTGRPKGVLITHRGLANLAPTATSVLGAAPDETVLQFASMSFDAAIFEWSGTLIAGATLLLASRAQLMPGPGMARFLRENGVTVLLIPPSLLSLLEPQELPQLRSLVVAGDALTRDLVIRWAGKCRMVNAYGPAETTVGITASDPLAPGAIPVIGRPFEYLQVYVLDDRGALSPIGVPGELYAAGVGLARGYLNRPALTAERFVPNPFSAEPGSRLYRTGDCVRWTVDGNLEFLGRLDNQIKIRGYRIEPGEIETALRQHPAVKQAAVISRGDSTSDQNLIAYVVPRRTAFNQDVSDPSAHLDQWQMIFDDDYAKAAESSGDPTFNIYGWMSSYNGQPIPAEEMNEWVEETVARATFQAPRRVLEIGCGTGLLLFRIAPQSEEYWATDFSPRALDYVRKHLPQTLQTANKVHLQQGDAENWAGIPEQYFDLVILNSVAQYFPDGDYLLRVIEGALQAVRPGGAIFLGDLRSLPLLECFHASVELARTPGETSCEAFARKVKEQLRREEELAVAPAFLTWLRDRNPRISSVQVQPKRGRACNELVKFRYDVILSVGLPLEECAEIQWLDWRNDGLSLDTLRKELEEEKPALLGVRQIPNARLKDERRTLAWLQDELRSQTVEALRRHLAADEESSSVDPQQLWRWEEELPYRIEISWAAGDPSGAYDVLFRRTETASDLAFVRFPESPMTASDPQDFFNDPKWSRRADELKPILREHLRQKLPEYMVPSAILMLERLPVTPNGKLDRSVLPEPEQVNKEISVMTSPRTPVEEILSGIWKQVLRLERVGINSQFFELGGHSLLATQAVSRIREILGVELPLRALFETPVLAELAVRIEALQREAVTIPAPPMTRVEQTASLPLSFAQQRLWFIEQLLPGTPVYNMPAALRLEGDLDARALRLSLSEIVRRHEVLRTVFPALNGEPVQKIQAPGAVPLPLLDLSVLVASECESAARDLIQQQAARPFDLSRGPLLKALLLRLAEQEHVLLVTVHHIIADGWSMEILARELSLLYDAFTAGKPTPLSELPVQYADFAVWQRQWLQGQVMERQLDYWREQLSGLEPLDLPTDYVRPPSPSYRGGEICFTIESELATGLRSLSLQEGVTLFMTLLAGWQVLLGRYAGQTAVAVGAPIAGRTRLEIEGLIGFFVNTLVFRTDLSNRHSFRKLLGQVRQTVLGAYAHQDLPFEKLVEELEPERDLSRSPLFQVMLGLQNAPEEELALSGLQIKGLRARSGTAKFELTLNLVENRDGTLECALEYSKDLFDLETIERLANHWKQLLTSAVRTPERSVGELELLSEVERRQFLADWNNPEHHSLDHVGLLGWFGRMVETQPNAIAVASNDRQLSYAALRQRARQLAQYLCSLGVERETRVAVYLDRGVNMLVGLLGILEAGGTYVPLDPNYPAMRLAYVMADSQSAVLLTESPLLNNFFPHQATVICLDTDWDLISSADTITNSSVPIPQNLAYVIYTSGSTGHPKGVCVTHAALTNFLFAMRERLSPGPQDTLLAVTTVSFDIAALELYLPLIVGGRVVIADRTITNDGQRLAESIARVGATVLQATPSTWRLLLEAGWKGDQGLTMLCGGEALSSVLADQLRLRGAALWNMYGPSETTVWSLMHLMTDSEENPSIGKAITNTQVYALDFEQEPIPVGVAGELYIGGDGLARGYLNRPGQTAERFVPHPYSDRPGARLYRTGDLVRWREDGRLEFLRRLDHQVKLRGYRIELGEIEAALNSCEGVRQSVAIVREDIVGQPQLVAYVIPEAAAEWDDLNLRKQLQERLPSYMTPSAILRLEHLPLTPNGKIDRKALPAPELCDRPAVDATPLTPLEELIAGIWVEVLRVSRVGRDETFFELGGHSLLATQVISRMRSLFGVELPLRTLFERQTLAALATEVERALHEGSAELAPQLVPVSHPEGVWPLSFAQQRLWFLDQLAPNSALYNMPHERRLIGDLNPRILQLALSEVARRHQALRTCFPTQDGQPVQRIDAPRPVPLPIIDLSCLRDEEAERLAKRLIREESLRPFNLSQGPLMRMRLLRLSAREHVLLATLHHIIGDAWSMSLFARELTVLYEAYVAQKPSPLPELPVQYADFAIWQRQWLQGEALERQLAYWRGQLAGLETLDLPVDYPRSATPSYRGQAIHFRLDPRLIHDLRALSRRQGVTLFMVLLAGWQTLLGRYARQTDVAIGAPIANRNRLEIEGLIGFFINQLVLRADLSGDPSFEALLNQVRRTVLEAHAHQDLPFERLVEAMATERDLNRSPLFQVALMFQNTNDEDLEISGMQVSGSVPETDTAKFEMTLQMAEGKDGGLVCRLEYAEDLFKRETIEKLAQRWARLLESAAAAPERSIGDLELLSAAERQQLLVEWNGSRTDWDADVWVHTLFERRAAQHPEAIALAYGDRQLSCAALNARANQLAHYLRALGVGPEVLVGVCFERGFEMVISLLGVLKAGGAYVPLDPSYPSDRLAYLMEDSGAQIILTDERLWDRLPAQSAFIVNLDREWAEIEEQSVDNPAPLVDGANRAYVIYTSGSTGHPKGTQVSFRNLTHSTQARFRYYQERVESFLLLSSFAFDSSVAGIFWTLCSGGLLVLIAEGEQREPARLLTVLAQRQVSHLLTLPSLYAALQCDEEGARWMRSRSVALSRVIVAGEACPPALVKRHFDLIPDVHLTNEYGPTEATVWSTAFECVDDQEKTARRTIPIGRPIANTQTSVLDERGRVIPEGMAGELYLGGPGIARGYLNQPGLTAERFLPDPFGADPGARLYRTGDLVRCLDDRNLEFLGRTDHQVKLRGYRIELGEIEAALAKQPGVYQAVVVMREDVPGSKRLVAYLVPQENADLDEIQIRAALQAKLPEYMIPVALTTLDRLPLTPNGKLDRKALPSPETGRGSIERDAEPRTEAEQILVEIWKQVLRRERIGIDDNFFEMGGDSILSIQIVSRANQNGFRLSVYHLFQHQTIRELASAGMSRAAGPDAPQSSVSGLVELTPILYWFLAAHWEHPDHYNQAVLLEPREPLESKALRRAVAALLAHHDALRMRYHEGKLRIVPREEQATVCRIDLGALPVSVQRQALEQAAAQLQTALNLEHGPLVRVGEYRLSEGERVQMIIHHLGVDGVSWRILLEDLETAYGQARRQEPLRLPAKTNSYQQWATALAQHARSKQVAATAEYWERLADRAANLKRLPRDWENGPDTIGASAVVEVAWSKEETAALLEQAGRRYGVAVQDVLLAGLVEAIGDWSGSSRVLVEMEGHGREEIDEPLDVNRTVGWFTTIYPALLERVMGDDAGERLQAARSQTPSARAGMSYGLLRYMSEDGVLRGRLAALKPEVSFNYLGQFGQASGSDTFFRFALESSGPRQDWRERRSCPLEFTCVIEGGRLTIRCRYSSNLHGRATIERVIERYHQVIQQWMAPVTNGSVSRRQMKTSAQVDLDPNEIESLLSNVVLQEVIE